MFVYFVCRGEREREKGVSQNRTAISSEIHKFPLHCLRVRFARWGKKKAGLSRVMCSLFLPFSVHSSTVLLPSPLCRPFPTPSPSSCKPNLLTTISRPFRSKASQLPSRPCSSSSLRIRTAAAEKPIVSAKRGSRVLGY